MPEASLRLLPGVNVEKTQTLNESGISSCNLIRFKDNLPQKLGGWEKFYPFNLTGVPRDLHGWSDLNAIPHLAVGTTQQLAVISQGDLLDITPQTLVSNFAPDFTTTMGSATVEIDDSNIADVTTDDSIFFNTPVSVGGIILAGLYPITNVTGTTTYEIEAAEDATASVSSGGAVPSFGVISGTSTVTVTLNDHGLTVGEFFTFPIATTVGGVTIDGTYRVITTPTANTFTINTSDVATTTTTGAMNGGNAQLIYFINLGPQALGVGYGLGGYGDGGYGTGIVPASQIGTPITATDWFLDNWGEILLANPTGGGIYQWRPNGGFVTAGLIPNAPIFNNGIFVAMPIQILVAWGSIATGQQQDPLTIRWSDAENFEEWSETSLTQAGSYRVPTGSMIVGGLQAPQQALIWTDVDCYAMQYLGPPLVFGFNKLSSGCGLIGPHAAAVMRGNVYWMSVGSFFVLTGNGVRQIPCTVWDVIFQNLDTANQSKIVAAPNSQFDEMTWYYPSLNGSGENDSYVKVNIESGSWDYGTLNRSAWMDQSVLGQPIGTTPTGIIYQHETSPDADGQPLVSWFETGWFVLSEAQDMLVLDWFFPDMKFGLYNQSQTATIQVTIYVVDYPNGPERTYGPFSVTQASQYVNTRCRGRQVAFKFESSDIGSFWRLGLMRARIAKDGRR